MWCQQEFLQAKGPFWSENQPSLDNWVSLKMVVQLYWVPPVFVSSKKWMLLPRNQFPSPVQTFGEDEKGQRKSPTKTPDKPMGHWGMCQNRRGNKSRTPPHEESQTRDGAYGISLHFPGGISQSSHVSQFLAPSHVSLLALRQARAFGFSLPMSRARRPGLRSWVSCCKRRPSGR